MSGYSFRDRSIGLALTAFACRDCERFAGYETNFAPVCRIKLELDNSAGSLTVFAGIGILLQGVQPSNNLVVKRNKTGGKVKGLKGIYDSVWQGMSLEKS